MTSVVTHTFLTDTKYDVRLGIEHVSTKSLADSHTNVDIQTNASDADAGVILVTGQQRSVVAVTVGVRVRMTHQFANICLGVDSHDQSFLHCAMWPGP